MGRGVFLLILLAAASAAPASSSSAIPLEAGFAETDITPPLKDKTVYLAGFGHNRKATGVHDPLKARAVVLRHGDRKIAGCQSRRGRLLSAAGRRPCAPAQGFTYVLVSSTHNHEGPDTMGLWGPCRFSSGIDAAYLRLIVESSIVEAVRAADAARRPVTAGSAPPAPRSCCTTAASLSSSTTNWWPWPFTMSRRAGWRGWSSAGTATPRRWTARTPLVSADFVGYVVDAPAQPARVSRSSI